MITNFKIFEGLFRNGEESFTGYTSLPPQVGDYVIINCDSKAYWANKIGQIVRIKEDYRLGWDRSIYSIKYTNVSKHILELSQRFANYKIEGDNITMNLLGKSILYWSKDIRELELKIDKDKFDL